MTKGRIFSIEEKNISSREALDDWMSLVHIPIVVSEKESQYGIQVDWPTINTLLNEGSDILLITDKKSKLWNQVFFIRD